MPLPSRQWMDESFPTVVRWTGLVLTVVLVFFSLAGFYVEAAPGFVAAGGMLLYKTVHNAARSNGNGKDREEVRQGQGGADDERWSHLP